MPGRRGESEGKAVVSKGASSWLKTVQVPHTAGFCAAEDTRPALHVCTVRGRETTVCVVPLWEAGPVTWTCHCHVMLYVPLVYNASQDTHCRQACVCEYTRENEPWLCMSRLCSIARRGAVKQCDRTCNEGTCHESFNIAQQPLQG